MQIIQQKAFHGTRSYELTENDRILISVDKNGELNQFAIDAAQLDPDPVRSRHRRRNWIKFFLLAGAIVVAAILFSAEYGESHPRIALFGSGGGLILAAYLFYVSIRKRQEGNFDVICYQNRFNGETELILHTYLPSDVEVAAFLTELNERISTTAEKPEETDMDHSTAREIERLALLKEKGYLSELEFVQAKKDLLQEFSRSVSGAPIGFQP